MASDLTTLTSQLAAMKQSMIDRLTAQGATGYTMQDTMEDIVAAYNTLRGLDYCTDTITENGTYVAPNGKTGYNNFVVNVPAGGPASHKKYKLLDRVYEDGSGDAIGTVVGFHYDANNVEYAIVCLDAQYRVMGVNNTLNTTVSPTLNGISAYSSIKTTATSVCDAVIAAGLSNQAVQHCRGLSFVVSGNTYYGQLPNISELVKIYLVADRVDALDSSDASYNSNKLLYTPVPSNAMRVWSCNMKYVSGSTAFCWVFTNDSSYSSSYGGVTGQSLGLPGFAVPILEIPNAVSNS